MDPERRTHGEGLDDLLERAVGEELDDDHPAGRGRPVAAKGQQDCEDRGAPGADVGDVAGEERDGDDRADERDAEINEPTATTTALKSATT